MYKNYGNYVKAFYVAGAFGVLGGLIMLVLPICEYVWPDIDDHSRHSSRRNTKIESDQYGDDEIQKEEEKLKQLRLTMLTTRRMSPF